MTGETPGVVMGRGGRPGPRRSSSVVAGRPRSSCRPPRGPRRSPTPPRTCSVVGGRCAGRGDHRLHRRADRQRAAPSRRGRRAGGHTAPSSDDPTTTTDRTTVTVAGGEGASDAPAHSSSPCSPSVACSPQQHRQWLRLVPAGSGRRRSVRRRRLRRPVRRRLRSTSRPGDDIFDMTRRPTRLGWGAMLPVDGRRLGRRLDRGPMGNVELGDGRRIEL